MANSYTPNVSQYGFSGGATEFNIERYTGIANSVKNFIGAPMQTDENPFHVVAKKVDNAAAIAMVVVGDYNRTKALEAFSALNFNNSAHTGQSDYLRNIGIHQDCKTDLTFKGTVKSASKTDQTGAKTIALNKNMFTNDQFKQLRMTGSVNVGGMIYKTDLHKLEQLDHQKNISNNRQNSVFSAATKSQRLSAGKNIYDAAISHLNNNDRTKRIFDVRNQGVATVRREMNIARQEAANDIDTLSRKDSRIYIDKDRVHTNAEMDEIIKDINSSSHLSASEKKILTEAALTNNEINAIQQNNILDFGDIDHNKYDLRHGRQLIARSLMGQDFYQGVMFTSKMLRVTQKAATLVVRGSAGIVYKTGSGMLGAVNKTAKTANNLTAKMGVNPNRILENATDLGRNAIKDAQKRDRQYHSMTKEERRKFNKQNRLNKKESRTTRCIDRADRRASHARARGDMDAANRFARKSDKLKNKKDKLISRRQRGADRLTFRQHLNNAVTRVTSRVFAPIRFITKPAQFVLNLYQQAKNWVIKTIAMPIVIAFAQYIGGCCVLVLLLYLFLSFASWNPIDSLITALNEKNYVQLIVNYTTNDLCESFLEVAKVDATKHFLDNMDSNTAIRSQKAVADKVDIDFTNGNISEKWYVMPEYGELGKVWIWEESDNQTTWPENGNGKTKRDKLFTRGLVDSDDYKGYVSPSTRECLSGPAENIIPITNMMHHRYFNDINFENWETALGYSYYMFVQSHDIARYDSALENSVIDDVHYTNPGYSFVYTNACARDALYSTPPSWNGSSVTGRNGDNEVCTNIYVHGHKSQLSQNIFAAKSAATELFSKNEDFFKKTVMQIYEDHPVLSGKWANFFASVTPGEGYYIVDSTCPESPAQISATGSLSGGTLDTLSDGKCTNFKIFQYGSDYLKCDIIPHGEGCYDKKGNLICTNPKHDDSHIHEFKETDDSCYVRVAVCQGHCGGHLTPQVNIVQKMSYEALITDDWFKTTHFLTKEEILGQDITNKNFLTDNIIKKYGLNTIDDWRDYWVARCRTWFYPFPRSWWGWNKTGAENVLKFFNKLGKPEAIDGDDKFLFEGWWKDTNLIDMGEVSELNGVYGSYYNPRNVAGGDEKYKMSKEMWSSTILSEDMAVTFNVGCGGTLTEAEIQQYMEIFRSMGLNETQLALLEDGLRHVGCYYYSLTGAGHRNGINSDSGPSECSGFISGILTRVLGTNWDNSAAGYASIGTTWSDPNQLEPGMILAHNKGGSNYSGHVVMYAGYIEGPDGPGYYIIDCTRTKNADGSQFRKVSESNLKRYNKALKTY